MKNPNPIYFKYRNEWRSWLSKNFNTEKEIWLLYPKKNSGNQRIAYNDAVEEALCFGWIDSTVQSIDEMSFMQRFTPRNPKSHYSQTNKERIKWLAERKLIHPTVLKEVSSIIKEKFEFPIDIIDQLKKDDEIWFNFNGFSDSYKRIRVAYIDDVRSRPEEFNRRLRHFLNKTKANKLIRAYGGMDK